MPRNATILQSSCSVLLLLISSINTASAQTPSPDVGSRNPPGAIPDINSSFIRFRQSGEVGTLESVQRIPAPDTFLLYTTQTYYHIDNVFLTSTHPQEANVWVGAVGLSVVPYSTYRWTPRFTVEGSLVRFDKVSFADYNMQSVGFDNRLGLTSDNMLSWNFGVWASRSESEEPQPGEFYKRVQIINNLNGFVQLDQSGHWALHVSPGVVWTMADPSLEDVVDSGAIVSAIWIPNRKLAFEPFFEGGYAWYPHYRSIPDPTGPFPRVFSGERGDFHVRSGVNFLWQISAHASVSGSAYWWNNDSDAPGADYELLPYLTINARIGF